MRGRSGREVVKRIMRVRGGIEGGGGMEDIVFVVSFFFLFLGIFNKIEEAAGNFGQAALEYRRSAMDIRVLRFRCPTYVVASLQWIVNRHG